MNRFLVRPRAVSLFALLLISSLAVSLSPLLSLVAKASSIYDNSINPTTSAIIKSQDGTKTQIVDTTNYYSLVDSVCPVYAVGLLDSIENGGKQAISVNHTSFGDRVNIFWSSPSEVVSTVFFDAGSLNQNPRAAFNIISGNDGGHGFISLQLSNSNVLSYWDCWNGTSTIGVYTIIGSAGDNYRFGAWNPTTSATFPVSYNSGYSATQPYLSNFPVTYPTGYDGELIPPLEPPKEDKYPPFQFVVNGSKIVAHYTGPTCIQNPDDIHQCAPFKLFWSTNNGAGIEDQKELEFSSDYEFTYPENDSYSLFLYYQPKGIPYAPLPVAYNYIASQVLFNIDGSSFKGSTDECVVDGDYCLSSSIVICDEIDNFFENINCKMANQFNVGVVNPSINAIKSLLTSFVVPSNPTCELSLTNVTIAPSKVFPLTNFSSSVCSNATTIRTAFPIVPLMLNFLLAILCITMIVRIINRLLDNNKHNLIEGI